MKEIKLDNVRNVRFSLDNTDVEVFSDRVINPLFRYNDEELKFDIDDNEKCTTINEKTESSNCISINGKNSINIVGSGIVIVNGKVISSRGNAVVKQNASNENNKTQLIVPSKSSISSLEIRSTSGKEIVRNLNVKDMELFATSSDIRLENLFVEQLNLKTISGDIELIDLDFLEAYINTTSGDVRAKLLEFYKNYRLKLSTISGSIYKQENSELCDIAISHDLSVKTISGDIRLTFKR